MIQANDLDMNVVIEAGMAFYWNVGEIIDGHTTIEHALPVATLYNGIKRISIPLIFTDVTTLFSRSGTGYTPTFIVNYGGLFGERYWYQTTDVWEDARLMHYAPQA